MGSADSSKLLITNEEARRPYKGLLRKLPIVISFVGKLIFITGL